MTRHAPLSSCVIQLYGAPFYNSSICSTACTETVLCTHSSPPHTICISLSTPRPVAFPLPIIRASFIPCFLQRSAPPQTLAVLLSLHTVHYITVQYPNRVKPSLINQTSTHSPSPHRIVRSQFILLLNSHRLPYLQQSRLHVWPSCRPPYSICQWLCDRFAERALWMCSLPRSSTANTAHF